MFASSEYHMTITITCTLEKTGLSCIVACFLRSIVKRKIYFVKKKGRNRTMGCSFIHNRENGTRLYLLNRLKKG